MHALASHSLHNKTVRLPLQTSSKPAQLAREQPDSDPLPSSVTSPVSAAVAAVSKLLKLFGNWLLGLLKDTDEILRVLGLVGGEEGVRGAGGACAPCPTNAVDVIFDLRW